MLWPQGCSQYLPHKRARDLLLTQMQEELWGNTPTEGLGPNGSAQGGHVLVAVGGGRWA